MCHSLNKEIICLILFVVVTVCEKPVIDTTHGKISGKKFKTLLNQVDYYAFMGIPYAAPPVENLRFLPPRSIDPWDDVLSATKEKQACIQYNYNVKKGQPLGLYGAEDCLYIDIFTPTLDENNRPVIVFLFNELFKNSYNKTIDYAPDFFIEEDIVIVTISHRLSVFGFLSFEDEVLSGNSGLKDIVAGLQWVKNNIRHFGGDSKRITLMGWKGGAAAVDLLIHSNAKGLFHSAILQSGTQISSMYLHQDVRQRAFRLSELLEFKSSSSKGVLEYLSGVPAAELLIKEIRAAPDDYTKTNQRSSVAFGPIVEKDVKGLITEYPENSSEKIDIPIMIGFNSREGLEMSLQYLIEPKYLSFVQKDFPLLMPRRLNFVFDPVQDGYDMVSNDIKNFYFPGGKVKIKSIPEYVTYIGDVVIAYPVDYMTRCYSNISTKPIYYYHFDYFSELNENKVNLLKASTVAEGTWGAASGDELCYLFKCPSLKEKYVQYNRTQSEEIIMLRKLVRMWANFVKYGDPSPADDDLLDGLKWPVYNNNAKEYLHIDKQITVKQDLYSTRFKFWDNLIEKWEKIATNGIVTDPYLRHNIDEL